jgi:hypothetical protein
MSTEMVPLVEPDAEGMLAHCHHLFGECLDGRIELAWTDATHGKLRHAKLFGIDELDELVTQALEVNRAGSNVYVGAALRKSDAPDGRCTDTHFLALPAFYCDIDAAGALETARELYRRAGCPPTASVVTGRHPHTRCQLFWRLETPERDPEAARRQNLALARTLGGDISVINPGRVLRLGGSIAWPLKPGRIVERTEFHLLNGDNRPRVYLDGQLARAFPPAVEKPEAPPTVGLNLPQGVSVESCLAAIRAGDHWHDHLLRLTGHWVARGWSDGEILLATEALTLPGWTRDQTRREVAAMVQGARAKWNVPDPQHAIDDRPAPEFRLTGWTADRYAGEAAPIQWLCTGTIPLGAPGLLASMGGLGKSYLALDMALQVAAGIAGFEAPRLILGGRIACEGAAVVLTAEDTFNAVHRRLDRIDPERRRLRHPERLMVVPLPDVGGACPLLGSDGRKTPCFSDLLRQLSDVRDLRLVIIDPLQAFVLADVNADPAAAQAMWSAMAEVCAVTGATLLLTHHMRKDGGFVITTVDDAREAIRGTTALVDGARFAYALWKAGEDDGRAVCTQLDLDWQPGGVVRGAIVKANEEADHSVGTYVREPSGLLRQLPAELDIDPGEAGLSMAKAHELLDEVQRRFDDGAPFSHALATSSPSWSGSTG